MEEVASEKALSSPLRCWWKPSCLICRLWQSPEWGLDFLGCQPFLVLKWIDNLLQMINMCHCLPWCVRLFKKKLPGGDSSLGCNLDHTPLTFSEMHLWRWSLPSKCLQHMCLRQWKNRQKRAVQSFSVTFFFFFFFFQIFFFPLYQYPSILFPPLYLGKVELPLHWSHHLGWSFKILGSQEKLISDLICTSIICFGGVRAVTLRLELVQEVISELYLLVELHEIGAILVFKLSLQWVPSSNIPDFETRLLFRILWSPKPASVLVEAGQWFTGTLKKTRGFLLRSLATNFWLFLLHYRTILHVSLPSRLGIRSLDQAKCPDGDMTFQVYIIKYVSPELRFSQATITRFYQ